VVGAAERDCEARRGEASEEEDEEDEEDDLRSRIVFFFFIARSNRSPRSAHPLLLHHRSVLPTRSALLTRKRAASQVSIAQEEEHLKAIRLEIE